MAKNTLFHQDFEPQESFILLVDNQTHRMRKLFNYLIFHGHRVRLVDSAQKALTFAATHSISLVVSQAMLVDSDITFLEKDLRKIKFFGAIVAVLDDPLAERAITELRFSHKYTIENLNDNVKNEKLIRILKGHNPQEPLENSYFTEWRERYSVTIPSAPQFIEKVNNYFLHKVSAYHKIHPHISGIRMSISEVLANAIEHGNKFDVTKTVRIDFIVGPHRVAILIRDQGSGFNFRSMENDINSVNKQLSERGRGLFIIRKFMDKVKIIPPGNRILLVKNLD